MNAANVARHEILSFGLIRLLARTDWMIMIRIFAGSFVDKNMNEKITFGELSTEEIQQIIGNTVTVTTKKATKFEMKLLNGTYREVSFKSCDISNMTVEILRIHED